MDDIDHRQIGNKLNLFHQQDEGPGMVFWHPRGWELYRVVEDYIRRRMRGAGFREVRTPATAGAFALGAQRALGQISGRHGFAEWQSG